MTRELLLGLKNNLDKIFDHTLDVYIDSPEFDKRVDETNLAVLSIINLHMERNVELAKRMSSEYQKAKETEPSQLYLLAKKLQDVSNEHLLRASSPKTQNNQNPDL